MIPPRTKEVSNQWKNKHIQLLGKMKYGKKDLSSSPTYRYNRDILWGCWRTHTHTHTETHTTLGPSRGRKKNSISSPEAQLKPSALPGLHRLSGVILLLQLRAWCSKPDFLWAEQFQTILVTQIEGESIFQPNHWTEVGFIKPITPRCYGKWGGM